jgi:hypothetical protein
VRATQPRSVPTVPKPRQLSLRNVRASPSSSPRDSPPPAAAPSLADGFHPGAAGAGGHRVDSADDNDAVADGFVRQHSASAGVSESLPRVDTASSRSMFGEQQPLPGALSGTGAAVLDEHSVTFPAAIHARCTAHGAADGAQAGAGAKPMLAVWQHTQQSAAASDGGSGRRCAHARWCHSAAHCFVTMTCLQDYVL